MAACAVVNAGVGFGLVRRGYHWPLDVVGSWCLCAVLLTLLAAAGTPGPAWWILATGGAVLSVVDAQTQLLPARFTYPLAAAAGGALVLGSILGGEPAALLRAAVAAS